MINCIIYGAGPQCPLLKTNKKNYIIAVDGGYSILEKNNINPDLIIGDFDSLGYVPSGKNTEVYSSVKDDTDMMLAIKRGIKITDGILFISGGFGGRPDHTFANFQCLNFINKHNRCGFLIGDNWSATIISDKTEMVFPSSCSGYFSVFSFSDKAEGVDIINASYSLSGATLTQNFPLGTSNSFKEGKETHIRIKTGKLLVLWENSQRYLVDIPAIK